jgi:hypothetical protein
MIFNAASLRILRRSRNRTAVRNRSVNYAALISNDVTRRILLVRLRRSRKIRHFVPLEIEAAIVSALDTEAV